MTKTCNATAHLGGGGTLTCGFEPGHVGPVHDDDRHVWGDIDLPPAGPQPARPESE